MTLISVSADHLPANVLCLVVPYRMLEGSFHSGTLYTGGGGGGAGTGPFTPTPSLPPCWVLARKCRTMGTEGALRKICLT